VCGQIAELHASIVEACNRNPEIDTTEARLALAHAIKQQCDLDFDAASALAETIRAIAPRRETALQGGAVR
jgi:hypothetical protein